MEGVGEIVHWERKHDFVGQIMHFLLIQENPFFDPLVALRSNSLINTRFNLVGSFRASRSVWLPICFLVPACLSAVCTTVPVSLFASLSVWLSVIPSVCLSVLQPACLLFCPPAYLSVILSVHPSVCLLANSNHIRSLVPACLSVYLPVACPWVETKNVYFFENIILSKSLISILRIFIRFYKSAVSLIRSDLRRDTTGGCAYSGTRELIEKLYRRIKFSNFENLRLNPFFNFFISLVLLSSLTR